VLEWGRIAPTDTKGASVADRRPDPSTPAPDEVQQRVEEALFEIRRIIAGQDAMLERVLVCLLAGAIC
jgi:hypothetical protein